jgi:hypothetical protein
MFFMHSDIVGSSTLLDLWLSMANMWHEMMSGLRPPSNDNGRNDF